MGDTDIFSDMALINELHEPAIGIVPIGDRFTMGGAVAALACRRFFKFETVMPCHYGTFPMIDQTADKFVAGLEGAVDRGRGAESRRDNFPLARFMCRPDIGEWKWAPASTTALRAKEICPSAIPCWRETQNAQQRAFLLDAANLCPVGAILGYSHTPGRYRLRAKRKHSGPAMRMMLAELQIPNIAPN